MPDVFGFLTLDEAQHLLALLVPGPGDVVVDVACGTGGPGLWIARESSARLIGVDPSPAGWPPRASAPRGPVLTTGHVLSGAVSSTPGYPAAQLTWS